MSSVNSDTAMTMGRGSYHERLSLRNITLRRIYFSGLRISFLSIDLFSLDTRRVSGGLTTHLKMVAINVMCVANQLSGWLSDQQEEKTQF